VWIVTRRLGDPGFERDGKREVEGLNRCDDLSDVDDYILPPWRYTPTPEYFWVRPLASPRALSTGDGGQDTVVPSSTRLPWATQTSAVCRGSRSFRDFSRPEKL
jgi:hypothetical protein